MEKVQTFCADKTQNLRWNQNFQEFVRSRVRRFWGVPFSFLGCPFFFHLKTKKGREGMGRETVIIILQLPLDIRWLVVTGNRKIYSSVKTR
jgi:hypothetical protein